MTERDVLLKMMRESPTFRQVLAVMERNGEKMGDLPETPMVVLCVPWPGGSIVGNKQVKCVGCSALLAVSPTTQAMMASRGNIDTPNCPTCAMKHIEEKKVTQ